MSFLDTMIERNGEFAADGFSADLKMMPSARTLIVGCVDPRVDPAAIFGLKTGEAAVLRNVGGRINPALLEAITLLRTIARAAGRDMGEGWNLVVLHHTDCGIIGCRKNAPELLARHLHVSAAELERMAIDDPCESVRLDVAAFQANPDFAAALTVSGVVYDVATGKVETVVPPSRLRDEV